MQETLAKKRWAHQLMGVQYGMLTAVQEDWCAFSSAPGSLHRCTPAVANSQNAVPSLVSSALRPVVPWLVVPGPTRRGEARVCPLNVRMCLVMWWGGCQHLEQLSQTEAPLS
ncbi:hypothetical protein JZ751_018745 [Albula glossodonta]|uniref:Uncharacterized protein n=1 Tax=Albula glossodonta TaxID=121402 RepID=A0A8T2NRD1_9TELE|nr:hypothetical protein JZ751_018745 [Albula glossodonta]